MAERQYDEIEKRVFNVDINTIQKKLGELSAEHTGNFYFKRAVLDVIPAVPNKWIRVRTDGQKTTLAIKERNQGSPDKEYEISVSDFDDTLALLKTLGGYTPRSIQENKRTSYEIDGSEVSIDEWPKIGYVVEIESLSDDAIIEIAKKLGLNESDLSELGVEDYYKNTLGIDVKNTPITFES